MPGGCSARGGRQLTRGIAGRQHRQDQDRQEYGGEEHDPRQAGEGTDRGSGAAVLRVSDDKAAASTEELVGLLVGVYGEGLAHIMTAIADVGPAGTALLAQLTDDPLVESLLLLHDLHPLDVDAGIPAGPGQGPALSRLAQGGVGVRSA